MLVLIHTALLILLHLLSTKILRQNAYVWRILIVPLIIFSFSLEVLINIIVLHKFI